MPRIIAEQGDITTYAVDAIVNAANKRLSGGGGVDGAIHRAAGPQLLEACRALNGCETGDAKITEGYRLPARYVIHAVGPVWMGGMRQEKELLARCYERSLQLAIENHAARVAFPCISTGVYRFPKRAAAEIALQITRRYLETHDDIAQVIFVCFSAEDLNYYQQYLSKSGT